MVVLLAPAVVVPLWVPIYRRTDPTFVGFPFFFWFQFALIIGTVVLTVSAYLVGQHVDRAARVRHGLPPVPDRTGTHRKAGDDL
jgi:hypothetical protein